MYTTIHRARKTAHTSRRECQRLARREALSRRTAATTATVTPVMLEREQLELVERLVRGDRTAVFSAVLALAGIGAGETRRRAVLDRISEAACWAQAESAISANRAAQIARHVKRTGAHRQETLENRTPKASLRRAPTRPCRGFSPSTARSLFEVQRDHLVLVKGAAGSRLLDRAVLISEPGVDRSGRSLHVISSEMRAIFGDFDGRVSIQRSPPRWVAPGFSAKAAAFVRSLH